MPACSARRAHGWRAQSRAELRIAPEEVLIGTVANLRPGKGYEVLLLPSVAKGRPVSVMEALALGVPVVATAVGGTAEVVSQGVNGILVKPNAPEDVANPLTALAMDPTRRNHMSAAARRAGRHFDIASAVRRTEEIYVGLAGTLRAATAHRSPERLVVTTSSPDRLGA